MEALSGADWEESFLEWEEVKEEKKFEGEDSRAREEPTDRPGREAKYSSRREKKAS